MLADERLFVSRPAAALRHGRTWWPAAVLKQAKIPVDVALREQGGLHSDMQLPQGKCGFEVWAFAGGGRGATLAFGE
jgi:hypothetical protein